MEQRISTVQVSRITEAIGNGWFMCIDTWQHRVGRYCDGPCGKRIPLEEAYYTNNVESYGAAIDLCRECRPSPL